VSSAPMAGAEAWNDYTFLVFDKNYAMPTSAIFILQT
jgi:hypothetical protein